jgi:hypothetical protein
MIAEKEIRAYQTKTSQLVCPVCATEEERKDPHTRAIAEDEIHDTKDMECVRCKKTI